VNSERHVDGVPRAQRRIVSPPGSPARDEIWPGANDAKDEKLMLRKLKREAQARGFKIRHSDQGFALIDTSGKRVDDRGDLTLREVKSRLKRG
jgi:hypothetical protein